MSALTVFIQSPISIMNNQTREQNIEVLIQKARGIMALQDKAWATEQQYLGYVRRFLRFTFTRPKSDSSEKKFEDWLTQMVLVDDCSVSAQDVAFAFDNLILLPHIMWHEIRIKKQTIWKMACCRKIFEISTRSQQVDLQMRLRFYKKRDDAKSYQRPISRVRQRCLRSRLKTWRQNESNAGICGLGLHETKMSQSKEQEFQNLGWARNQNSSRVDRRLREVFISRWIEAFNKTFSRQNQKRRQLRAGQCSLGVANSSAKQQEKFKNNFPCREKSICGSMVTRIRDSSERYFTKIETWVERQTCLDRAFTRTVLETKKIIHAEAKSVPHPFDLIARRSTISVSPLQPARIEFQNQ